MYTLLYNTLFWVQNEETAKKESDLQAGAHGRLVGECQGGCTVLGQLVAALHAQQRLQTCQQYTQRYNA